MERTSDYQFVSTDVTELTDSLSRLYEKITGNPVLSASPEQLFLQWMASILVQERVLLNYTGNQNIPSRAGGRNLEALAELTHCRPRPEAKAASCNMQFFI